MTAPIKYLRENWSVKASLLLLLCIFLFRLSAQQKTLDSLRLALNHAKHDTTKAQLWVKIGNVLYVSSPDTLLWFAERAEEIIRKYPSPGPQVARAFNSVRAEILNNRAFVFQRHGELDSAMHYYFRGAEIQKQIGDKEGLAWSYNNIATIYNNTGREREALELNQKSLELKKQLNDQLGIAQTLNNMGLVYSNLGQVKKALEAYQLALKIREQINDQDGVAHSLSTIASLYSDLQNYEAALNFYSKSLAISEKASDKYSEALAYSNMGVVYLQTGYIDTALQYFNKSLELRKVLGDKKGLSQVYNNIGNVYRKGNDNHQALLYFEKSLELKEALDDKKGISISCGNIGYVLFRSGKIEAALQYGERSLKLAKEIGGVKQIQDAALLLSDVYFRRSDFKRALEMKELFLQMRDSIMNTETKKSAVRSQLKYEYEKRAAADSVKYVEVKKVNEAELQAQAAKLKQEKTQFWFLLGGLSFVMCSLLFVVNRFRLTRKQKKIIEEQKLQVDEAFSKLQEKNKEVMDSIYYARRIQRTLITSEKYIARSLRKLTKG